MDTDFETVNIQRILLIDIDNCPSEINKIIENLNIYTRIIICYGGQIPKISLNLVVLLADAIHEKKLEIIGMTKKGKNAADFGLCFLAGRLSAQMPQAEFLILSNDSDLDHVVNMLKDFKHSVKRIGITQENITATIPSTESPKITPELQAFAQEYYEHVLRSKNRPAKEATLLNSLRAFCTAKCPNKEQLLFNLLKNKGYFSISASGTILYTN